MRANPKRAPHPLSTHFLLLFLASAFVALPSGSGDRVGIPLPEATLDQKSILRELHQAAPSGYDGPIPWMLERWTLDLAAELAPEPTGPGNAAAHFRRLENLYAFEKDLLARGEEVSGVNELLAAARCRECRLVPDFYPPFDNAGARTPDFVVLRTYLGALLLRAGELEKAGEREAARTAYEAAVTCGVHLARDGSNTVVAMTGIIFQLRAVREYGQFLDRAGMHEAAGRARRIGESLTELLRLFYWKANHALGMLEGFDSLPAAVEIALMDKDPAWRAQAVLRLGVFRHGAPDGAGGIVVDPEWRRTAEKALEQAAAEDPDQSIRKLATWSVLHVRPESGDKRAVLGE
ncbi:MAG: hypothetical protein LBJ46_07540 [Planctomycetota bacterium]|jgi:hypothetical protein|nr:hypothetical protein [Planctomycetota bacterium]